MSATANPSENPDKTLEQRIDETRRLVLQVDVSLSVLTLVTVLFGGLILAVLADHWIFREGLSGPMRLGIFLALILLVGLVVYRRILPLFLYPINPVYAARILEQGTPSFKNSIVNWILLRQERMERGQNAFADKLSERMFDGVTRTAARTADSIAPDHAVDTRQLMRWGILFTALVLFLIGYTLFSPKNPLQSIARIIMPFSEIDAPQSVEFRDVRPGDLDALQGEKTDVSVEVVGRSREPVYLFFTTDDGQAVRQAIPMAMPEGKTRYETVFPPGKSGFVSGIDYWFQQGESRSKTFRIDVRPVASLEIASITYRYPKYTGLEDETVEHAGDIRAVEGTEVEIRVRSTIPLDKAEMLFDHDANRKVDLKIRGQDSTEAHTDLTLQLDPGSREAVNRTFTFRAVDRDGYESRRSGVFRFEVLPDKAPIVQWSDTAEELRDVAQLDVPLNGSVEFPVQAEDLDFGLRFVRFHVESGNKRIRPVELLESPPDGPTDHAGTVQVKTVFSPVKSRLSEGDTAEVWAEAVDTKLPEANSSTTRRMTIRVVAPQQQEEPPKQQEQKQDQEQDQKQDRKDEKQNADDSEKRSDDAENRENDRSDDPSDRSNDDPENRNQNDDPAKDDSQNDGKGKSDSKNSEKQSEASQDNGEAEKDGNSEGNSESGEDQRNPDERDKDPSGGKDGKKDSKTDDSRNDGQEQQEQDSENGNQGQKPDKSKPEKSKPDKPIDPKSNSGDAMDKIIDKMKEDGKMPPENELNKQDRQDSKKDENESQSPKNGKENSQQDKKEQNEENKEGNKQDQEQSSGDCPPCDNPEGESSKDGGNSAESSNSGNKAEGEKENGENSDPQNGASGGEKSGENAAQGDNSPTDSSEKPGGGDSQDSGSGNANENQVGNSESATGAEKDPEKGTEKQDTEKQAGKAQQNDERPGREDPEKSDQQGSGGDKDGSPEKPGPGGDTTGGDQSGNPNSSPEHRPGDNREADKQDIPVDPSDAADRKRDDTLDPNLKDRKTEGGDPTDPGETKMDRPQDTVSTGDEGRGRESKDQGQSDRTQAAKDGMKGDQGDDVEQKGGSKGSGDSQTGEGESKETENGKNQGNSNGESGKSDEKGTSEREQDSGGSSNSQSSDSQNDDPSTPKEQGKSSENGPSGQKSEKGSEKQSSPKNDSSSPNDSPAGNSDSEGTPGGGGGSSIANADTEREKANLEYSEKVTNLVLEYLEDQLENGPDKELLSDLGWTEKELREFHQIWKGMSDRAKQAELEGLDSDEWKEALKSLGLTPGRAPEGVRGPRTEFKDQGRSTEFRRYEVPARLKKRTMEYNKEISK